MEAEAAAAAPAPGAGALGEMPSGPAPTPAGAAQEAVRAFLAAAGRATEAVADGTCEELRSFGTAPEEWLPTLKDMPAETLDALLESVRVQQLLADPRALVAQIFEMVDEDKDGRLNFAECASLATRTGGGMDRGTYDGVAELVSADAEAGLTLSNLEDVYIKFKMGDAQKDYCMLSGAPLPQGSAPEPAPEAAPEPAAAAGDGTASTRAALLGELEQRQAAAFSWEEPSHTEQLARVWAAVAPPPAAITATERLLLPGRLELLMSLPLFRAFGSKLAQVRLANAMEEVDFEDGAQIISEGADTEGSSCMFVVTAGSPVAMSSSIGTVTKYAEGEWFGERCLFYPDRALSVVANGGTRCLKLSRDAVVEVMHGNLAGLLAHFEDQEAAYETRRRQLEGALEAEVSSRALQINFKSGRGVRAKLAAEQAAGAQRCSHHPYWHTRFTFLTISLGVPSAHSGSAACRRAPPPPTHTQPPRATTC